MIEIYNREIIKKKRRERRERIVFTLNECKSVSVGFCEYRIEMIVIRITQIDLVRTQQKSYRFID